MMLSKYDFNNNDEELARTAIGQQNVQMSAMHVAMLTMGAACERTDCKATYDSAGLQNQGEKNYRGKHIQQR